MTQMSMRQHRAPHRSHHRSSHGSLSGDKILALIAFFILLIFVFSSTMIHFLLPPHDELKDNFVFRQMHTHKNHFNDVNSNADSLDGILEKTQKDRRRKKRRRDLVDSDGEDPSHKAEYESVRMLYNEKLPHESIQDATRLHNFVNQIRKPKHEPKKNLKSEFQLPYDIENCPEDPPVGYPMEWPILDVIKNWNPNNISYSHRPQIYQGLCRFDHGTELHKALNYRKAELPFLLRDDPEILKVVERWNQPGYLSQILGKNTKYRTEYSDSNSLMFYRERKGQQKPEDWEPPISDVKLTYDEWEAKASQPLEDMSPDDPHWYFRLNAKGGTEHFMFKELPFFLPEENFYIVDASDTRGINCRFGMAGNTAAAHFDGSRNFIMLFGGERRYFLSHPKNCPNLALFPKNHPSGRHTAVDWSDPDLDEYPEFADGLVNEVVLQAGDVLYLPTHWFHHIVSLDLNWQCNSRSGITDEFQNLIKKCGF